MTHSTQLTAVIEPLPNSWCVHRVDARRKHQGVVSANLCLQLLLTVYPTIPVLDHTAFTAITQHDTQRENHDRNRFRPVQGESDDAHDASTVLSR